MNDQRKGRALRGRAGRNRGGRGSGRAGGGQVRLWGHHAVEAALLNPERVHRKLWATREAIAGLSGDLPADFPIEYAAPADLARLVARDAPHQGLVLDCAPLEALAARQSSAAQAALARVIDSMASPPCGSARGQRVQRDRGGVRYIEAFDAARNGQSRERVAVAGDVGAQAFALGPENQRDRPGGQRVGEQRVGLAGEPDPPIAGLR